MSNARHLSVIVLGAGNVGSAFVRQLTRTHEHLAQRYGVKLQIVALADSSGAIFNSANVGTAGYPFLTVGASNVIRAYGTAQQIKTFMEPMVAGRFFG